MGKQILWVGNHVTKVMVEDADVKKKTNYFTSLFGKTKYDTSLQFNANNFHFHLASEHTINGRRFDLEMHTVHFPSTESPDIVASAIGIIFDTKRYDKKISDETSEIID